MGIQSEDLGLKQKQTEQVEAAMGIELAKRTLQPASTASTASTASIHISVAVPWVKLRCPKTRIVSHRG